MLQIFYLIFISLSNYLIVKLIHMICSQILMNAREKNVVIPVPRFLDTLESVLERLRGTISRKLQEDVLIRLRIHAQSMDVMERSVGKNALEVI